MSRTCAFYEILKDALLEHPPQLLRAIADMNQLALPETGARDQWAATLADELARPEVIQRTWQSLTPPERAALESLILRGGRTKAFQILRDQGEIRAFGPVALARDKPWLKPANVTEGLWYRGLIQRAFDVVGEFRGEIFFIPGEILPHLPRPSSAAGSFAVKAAAAPGAVSDQGDALIWDMFGLLVFVSREEPRYEEHSLLHADDRRDWTARLLIPDPAAGPRKPFGLAQQLDSKTGAHRSSDPPRQRGWAAVGDRVSRVAARHAPGMPPQIVRSLEAGTRLERAK